MTIQRALFVLLLVAPGCASVSPPCDAEAVRCGDWCRDLARDPTNCGECGNACATGQVCVEGACLSECPQGLAECDGTCANLASDPENCGGCGDSCPSGWLCLDGTCDSVCDEPRLACGGSCVDPSVDPNNCGDCDVVCDSGLVCSDGICTATCQPELEECDERCVDVMSDRANCGSCGNACDAGYLCDRGGCVLSCPPGQRDCTGRCVDVLRDRTHCGGCGNRCADGEYCDDGECALTCGPGLTACDGECVDVDHDPAHCGGCGEACPDDAVYACAEGECESLPCGNDCWGNQGCMTGGGRCIRFTCRAGNTSNGFCNRCMGWREVTYSNWMNDGFCADTIAKYREVSGTQTKCGPAVDCCASSAACTGGDNAWHFWDGVNNHVAGPCLGCAGNANCSYWNFTDNSAYTRITICQR